jgi:hypothetical protein
MSQFTDFVEAQVGSCNKLQEWVVAAVHDDDVPMSWVDDDLESAIIRVIAYDRAKRVVTAQLKVPGPARLPLMMRAR